MATCATEESSLQLPPNIYRRQLHMSAYDSGMPLVSRRKRHLSEQNGYSTFFTEYSDDSIGINKRTKLGNYFMIKPPQGTKGHYYF